MVIRAFSDEKAFLLEVELLIIFDNDYKYKQEQNERSKYEHLY